MYETRPGTQGAVIWNQSADTCVSTNIKVHTAWLCITVTWVFQKKIYYLSREFQQVLVLLSSGMRLTVCCNILNMTFCFDAYINIPSGQSFPSYYV